MFEQYQKDISLKSEDVCKTYCFIFYQTGRAAKCISAFNDHKGNLILCTEVIYLLIMCMSCIKFSGIVPIFV